jgi:hypothetical protein
MLLASWIQILLNLVYGDHYGEDVQDEFHAVLMLKNVMVKRHPWAWTSRHEGV